MLETASRIHSANGGVSASQARDVEAAAAFTDAVCISGAILSYEGADRELFSTECEVLMRFNLVLAKIVCYLPYLIFGAAAKSWI